MKIYSYKRIYKRNIKVILQMNKLLKNYKIYTKENMKK